MVPAVEDLSTEAPFDLILLLDVIEHMTDPGSFLMSLQSRLAPGAKLLISVPNVAHWAMRAMLLAGYFEYMERGPLDKTHYRFFTRRYLTRMIAAVPGLELVSLSGSIVPLELMLPEVLWKNPVFDLFSAVRIQAANGLPGLFAYQLLAEVVKK
jgi:SAM-dependent methyltransferase